MITVDVLLDPFAARWRAVLDAAVAAEELGFGAVWTWDHLAGSAHRAPHVLEAWTVLAALAARTERVGLGPLVLNVANRDPGTLAVAAATLQEVSSGRLHLGIGAGGGPGTPYAGEQRALGREVPGAEARRAAVEGCVAALRAVWADGAGAGFLHPEPSPPVVVGGFGPKMAELAGRIADGFNTQAGHPRLADLVATARRAAGARLAVSVFCGDDPRWYGVGGPGRARLEAAGIDRIVVLVAPPYPAATLRAIASAAGLAQP